MRVAFNYLWHQSKNKCLTGNFVQEAFSLIKNVTFDKNIIWNKVPLIPAAVYAETGLDVDGWFCSRCRPWSWDVLNCSDWDWIAVTGSWVDSTSCLPTAPCYEGWCKIVGGAIYHWSYLVVTDNITWQIKEKWIHFNAFFNDCYCKRS